MLVNKDLNNSFQFGIELIDTGPKRTRVCNYSVYGEEFGREMDWLAPGAGVLLRLE